MARYALLFVVLLGCSKNGEPPLESRPPAPPAEAAEVNATQANGAQPKSEFDTPWDPNTPVDLKKLETRQLFVAAENTSVCPTVEQARARDCGHSIESVTLGQRFSEGSAVTVVGQGPVDGFWRAIRFQKAGTLPSWVRADDLAVAPKLPALDLFDARADVKKAVDGSSLTAAKIAKLKKGTIVAWRRDKGIRFGVDDLIYVPGKAGVVAVHIGSGLEPYMENHGCLINADCLDLDYTCSKGGYCDQVSVLARVTGKTSPVPEDEYKVWPAAWKGAMPLLEAVAIGDRFGLHAKP